MATSALSHIDRNFTRTLADAFPPADADTGMALVAQAALKLVNKQTGRAGCHQPTNEFPKFREVKVSRVMHSVAPSDKETKSEGIEMRYGPITKTLGERVSAALRRRLFPHTNLTRKQLQDALKCSVGTMDNLLSGHHDPSGRILDKLVAFFRDGFVNEVWGANNIHCICTLHDQRAAALRKLQEAQEELRRLA
jgi:hypothetical protein